MSKYNILASVIVFRKQFHVLLNDMIEMRRYNILNDEIRNKNLWKGYMHGMLLMRELLFMPTDSATYIGDIKERERLGNKRECVGVVIVVQRHVFGSGVCVCVCVGEGERVLKRWTLEQVHK